jgi:hypothetical protein
MAFDFDFWVALAGRDPVRFEAERRRQVQDAIRAGQEAGRLAALQWRIDQERRRGKSALGGCLRVQRMMWMAFGELNARLSGFRRDGGPAPQATVAQPERPARILPFRPDGVRHGQ